MISIGLSLRRHIAHGLLPACTSPVSRECHVGNPGPLHEFEAGYDELCKSKVPKGLAHFSRRINNAVSGVRSQDISCEHGYDAGQPAHGHTRAHGSGTRAPEVSAHPDR